MADARLYLEHVDTGRRVLIAKRFGGEWRAFRDAPNQLAQVFENMEPAESFAETMDDGTSYGRHVWRLAYEDMDKSAVPPNTAERG